MKVTMEATHATRRRWVLLSSAMLSLSPNTRPAVAALSGMSESATADEMAAAYAAGARADGGRGANTMIKKRAESGVQRIGKGSPMFKPGSILDAVRSADGSAVDIAFAYPKEWSVSEGPNLDVRNVRTSDSAFLLVAAMPAGETFEALPKKFFTDLLFRAEGKYGAYGGVDDFAVTQSELTNLKAPSGTTQPYRRISMRFDVLTYNQNTVRRRALLSATMVGGSVYVLVASCLGSRYKEALADLAEIQTSFRALTASRVRLQEPQTESDS